MAQRNTRWWARLADADRRRASRMDWETRRRVTRCVSVSTKNHSGDKRGGIVAASMTREQIAEAQALALEWANR